MIEGKPKNCPGCVSAKDRIDKLEAQLKEDNELMQSGLRSMNELHATILEQRKEIAKLRKQVVEYQRDNWKAIQERIRMEMNTHPGWSEEMKKEPWEKPITILEPRKWAEE